MDSIKDQTHRVLSNGFRKWSAAKVSAKHYKKLFQMEYFPQKCSVLTLTRCSNQCFRFPFPEKRHLEEMIKLFLLKFGQALHKLFIFLFEIWCRSFVQSWLLTFSTEALLLTATRFCFYDEFRCRHPKPVKATTGRRSCFRLRQRGGSFFIRRKCKE